MCQKYVKIKNSAQAGITWCYVPCGTCVDCRRKQAQSWSFRINSEFINLKNRGWNVGFCTLTYNNENLPTIPEHCFKSEYKRIPCFNRKQVRQWIDDVRQYCKYHFDFTKDNRIRYFIATELGTLRHRPHLHVILAWPPSVSYQEMHKICTDFWDYGYLFPRDYRGDKRMLSFEIVGDGSKCFTYVSKYVCKDLELTKLQSESEFYTDKDNYEENSREMLAYSDWRNCQSFHLQSQSLGFEAIKNLSDDEKMSVYVNGLIFSADKNAQPQQVPIYIKHKLIFDNYYIFDEDGKRLVRRKANDFFLNHAHEIFDKKAEWYQKYLRSSESEEYYISRGLGKDLAKVICQRIKYYADRANEAYKDLDKDNKLGKMYLAYHRVDSSYRFDIELCDQWLLRYYPDVTLEPRIDTTGFSYNLSWLDCYWECVDMANSLLGSFYSHERFEAEERIAKIRDFFNNIIKK